MCGAADIYSHVCRGRGFFIRNGAPGMRRGAIRFAMIGNTGIEKPMPTSTMHARYDAHQLLDGVHVTLGKRHS
jgi:hypothetical protein